VDTAKPQPDIVQVALERAGVSADRAVFVGDTVWDGKASTSADVAFVAVRSGGVSRAELEEAGASVVYDGPGDLLANLDESPIGALARQLPSAAAS
jgi:phosphoglycolate phosphatase-like HAD superfamily hydrolase